MPGPNLIHSLMMQDEMQKQRSTEGWKGVSEGIGKLGESLQGLTGTSKTQRLKKAGEMIINLGGFTEKNLNAVRKAYNLNNEEVKEFVVTFMTLEKWKTEHSLNRKLSPALIKKLQGQGLIVDENSTILSMAKSKELQVGESRQPDIQTVVGPGGAVSNIEKRVGPLGEGVFPYSAGKDKEYAAKNYILPDKTIVLSYDRGRTYLGENREQIAIPPGSIEIPAGANLTEVRSAGASKEAQKQLNEMSIRSGSKQPEQRTAEKASLGGTGPYRSLASLVEAIAGGFGVDRLIGTEGLFPETAANKQLLRAVRQIGKTALIMSPRYPVREQEIVEQLFPDPDRFWVNPRIEAKKIAQLSQILNKEKEYNLKAITESFYPEEIARYRKANSDIDRLLSLLSKDSGQQQSSGGLTRESLEKKFNLEK